MSRPYIDKLLAERNVEKLIKALRYNPDSKIREQAAEALGELRDARAVEALESAIYDQDDESGKIGTAAIEALGQIRNDRAVGAIFAALTGGGATVNKVIRVSDALGKIQDRRAIKPLIHNLSSSDEDIRVAARCALANFGSTVIEPLSECLNSSYKNCREEAALLLIMIGKAAAEPLFAALTSKHSDVREAAAYAVGKLGDQRAVEPLISALKDEHGGVRWRAAAALGKIGGWHGIRPLVAALSDRDSSLRKAAGEALTQRLGWQPQTVEEKLRLAIALQKWEEVVALGPIAVEPLLAVLIEDKSANVREGVVGALEVLGWKPQVVGYNYEEIAAIIKAGDAASALAMLSKKYNPMPPLFGTFSESVVDTAIRDSDIDVLRFMLQHGAQVPYGGQYGTTSEDINAGFRHASIWNAIENDDEEGVRLLLEYSANPTKDLETVMTIRNHKIFKILDEEEVVRLLLERGADATAAFTTAVRTRNHKICKILLDYGTDAQEGLWKALVNGADATTIGILMAHGASLLKVSLPPLSVTPLHVAAELFTSEAAFRTVLDRGVNVNATDGLGNTPLHSAAYGFNLVAMRLLLEYGAYVNAKNHMGDTPLQIIVDHGHRHRPISLAAGLHTLGLRFYRTRIRRLRRLRIALLKKHGGKRSLLKSIRRKIADLIEIFEDIVAEIFNRPYKNKTVGYSPSSGRWI